LSVSSEYFRALFTIGMRESLTGVVQVRHCTKETLLALLEYVYTSDIGEERCLHADGDTLWECAELYGIDGLRDWLRESVRAGGCVWGPLNYAVSHIDPRSLQDHDDSSLTTCSHLTLARDQGSPHGRFDGIHARDHDGVQGNQCQMASFPDLQKARRGEDTESSSPSKLTPHSDQDVQLLELMRVCEDVLKKGQSERSLGLAEDLWGISALAMRRALSAIGVCARIYVLWCALDKPRK
jgi:hypothetical protein